MPRRVRSLAPVVRALSFVLLSGTAALVLSSPVPAQPKPEKKAAALDYSAFPSHVHFSPLLVPIDNANPSRAMVTIYFGPHKIEKIGFLCRMAPRVNDAVLSALSREPIPMNGRKMAVTDVGKRLLVPINAALGEDLVKEIHVLAGPPTELNGGETRLPFGRSGGCKRITDMLDILERKQQQEAAKH